MSRLSEKERRKLVATEKELKVELLLSSLGETATTVATEKELKE
jgi:hypothetical protein